MSILKKRISGKQIRCFNIIDNQKDPKFGMNCERLLLCTNSSGDAAGYIKCGRCGAYYELKDGFIHLTKKKSKGE